MKKEKGFNSSHVLIKRYLEETNERSLSAIGLALKNSASNQKVVEVDSELVLNDELDKGIRAMKVAEQENDLCYIDYGSWNKFPTTLKTLILKILNPVPWNGFLFRKSELNKFENQFWMLLPGNLIVCELRIVGGFQLKVLSSESGEYDWMAHFKFRDAQKEFKSRCVRSIGFEKGEIRVKNFELAS